MIVAAASFLKSLAKLRSVAWDSVASEIGKHARGVENFVDLGVVAGRRVLKGYLNAGRVRLVVLLQESRGTYVPCFVAKKESADGFNVTRRDLEGFLGDAVDRVAADVAAGRYELREIART